VTSLAEIAYGAGWSIVKATPRALAWPVFRAAADRAARRNGPGTQRLRRNLRQVVGPDMPDAELDELVRAGLRSYARYWLDAFQLPRYSREQFLTMFAIERGRHGLRHRAAALGQLGHGRRLGLRERLAADHGRGAAQAGGRLPEVRRVPRVARHGDHPDRRW
jgi:Lauroyl/myristoyl acyltransferase